MELRLSADLLERFLGVRPKVFVGAADPLAGTLGSPGEPLYDVWVFSPGAGQTSASVWPVGAAPAPAESAVALTQPPAGVCVLAASSAEEASALEGLRAWWQDHGHGPAPALCRLRAEAAPDATAGVLRALCRGVLAETEDSARRYATYAGELHELRVENEQQRVVMEAMQGELHRLRACPPLSVLHLPPSDKVYAPAAGKGTVVQALPVSAEGLAGFDLHFPPQPSIRAPHVFVRLHALDLNEDIGVWRLQAEDLGRGWVRCWCPTTLTLAAHYLEIRVEWACHLGSPPVISLAGAGDWNELLARPTDGAPLEGCLAMTVWSSGVPGLRLRRDERWCTSGQDGTIEYALAPADVGRMTVRFPPPGADWPVLQLRPSGAFLLHPLATGAVSALLPHGCLPGLERVTAVGAINHPNAKAHVEYALLASRSDTAQELVDAQDPAACPDVLAFSGWQAVPPDGQPRLVSLEFSEPLDVPAHLVFATRGAPNVCLDFAWAEWSDVRFRMRGRTAQAVTSPAAKDRLRLVA